MSSEELLEVVHCDVDVWLLTADHLPVHRGLTGAQLRLVNVSHLSMAELNALRHLNALDLMEGLGCHFISLSEDMPVASDLVKS